MWLQNPIISQNKKQTLEELWKELVDTIEDISFKGKLAIFSGLCAKSLKKYIHWEYIENKEQLLYELRKVDKRHQLEELKGIERKEVTAKENIQKREKYKSNEEYLGKMIKENIKLKDQIREDKERYELQIETLKEFTELYKAINKEIKKKGNSEETIKNQKIETEEKENSEEAITTKIIQKELTENNEKAIKPEIITDKRINKEHKRDTKQTKKQYKEEEIIQNIPSVKTEQNVGQEEIKLIEPNDPELNEEIIREKYGSVTALEIQNEGYPDEECTIKTEEGKIIKGFTCTLKKGMYDKTNEAIDKLLNKGYIKESRSEWNNPIKPVIKPDGSIRLCMNMMALNSITQKEANELPDIENIIDSMQGANYFSVLDLKEGYFQIRLAKEDQHKTAFTVNQKKYEWNRMPMGFKNAPTFFQRIMDKELREHLYKGCMVYLDDIVVYAKTVDEHDRILKEVLEKLKEKNLKINMEKLQLRKSSIKLLGMQIENTSDKK